MEALGTQVKKSVGWMLVGRVIKFVIHGLSSIAIVRLLEPRIFGIYSIAGLFIGFTKQFQGFGMGQAIIRHPELKPEHLSTFFVANLLGSTSLCAALWLAAPLLETLFREPAAVPVLRFLALGFLLNPFSSVSSAVLQRRMEFRAQTVANVVFALSQVLTALVLAWHGFGVWSLAIGQLTGQTARTLTLVLSARTLPRPRYSRSAARELAGFSVGMWIKNAALYAQDRVDYFVVGRWLGATALGFYERAYRIPEALVKEMGSTANNVLYSAYSQIQGERERVHAAFRRVVLALSLPAFPVLIGALLVAPALVHVVFGARWDPTVAPLQILCLGGLFRLASQTSSTLMNALGQIRLEVWSRLVSFVLMAAGCYFGTRWGLVGVAAAIVAAELFMAVVMGAILVRVGGIPLGSLFRPQIPALQATLVMAAGVLLFQTATAAALGLRSPAMLASSVLLGAGLYLGTLCLTRNPAVLEVIGDLLRDARPILQRLKR